MPAVDKRTTTTNTNTNNSSSDYSGATGKDAINAMATIPYVAIVKPSTNSRIDYSKLRSARVAAIMFYGGELYNFSHSKKTYVNPYLDTLVKDCNASGMAYGIYVNIRARNTIEADAECRALYYVISHYPPVLGIWLSLKTNNLRMMNDDILEVYYKFIDKWGLGQRCGLYLEEHQLSDISWTSFENRFYLWLAKPMNVSEIDDELLDPLMFEVPY